MSKTGKIITIVLAIAIGITFIGVLTRGLILLSQQNNNVTQYVTYHNGYCIFVNNIPTYLVYDYGIDEHNNLVLTSYQPFQRDGSMLLPYINTVIISSGTWRIEQYKDKDLRNIKGQFVPN
jgi:hypothetical protein